ncbi:gas vesicle protein GvpO [Salsuginibacillus halophilus]|uniref:Gas vesicle protein GvpO n=1 Tax=Salsuginibacillus halophilus TaxID=517424 RepID=A0A2P8HLK9_9BACI|nr:gas vesicle protein GvpO [Salsuginibacillus halophilus]PSL47081.1 gas vesicle protein GvpO [Salsuginibacillus halophilus]
MKLNTVIKNVHLFFEAFVAPPFRTIAVMKREDGEKGWVVQVEVIEERERMKAVAKDEMVGVYEAITDADGEVEEFERLHHRYRTELFERGEEE